MQDKTDYRSSFIRMPMPERIAILKRFLRQSIAAHLQLAECEIDVHCPFRVLDARWEDNGALWGFGSPLLLHRFGVMTYPFEWKEFGSIERLTRHLAVEMDWPPTPTHRIEDLAGGRAWLWGQPSVTPSMCNPPVAFVLSPGRSGSTLLRSMLANHPALFAPPELNLLWFESMGRRRELARRYRQDWLLYGPYRVWEHLGAQSSIPFGELENGDVPTQEVYRLIQGHCAGRLLIDKSPMNAASSAWLSRAESLFESPLYIHLVRSPHGTIESFVRTRFHQLFHDYFTIYDPNPWLFAEKYWTALHRNILGALAKVEESRRLTVHYEALVAQPKRQLIRICDFLNITFKSTMLEPYSGMAAELRGVGDPNWVFRRAIDPDLALSWSRDSPQHRLGDLTLQLARKFNYEV